MSSRAKHSEHGYRMVTALNAQRATRRREALAMYSAARCAAGIARQQRGAHAMRLYDTPASDAGQNERAAAMKRIRC